MLNNSLDKLKKNYQTETQVCGIKIERIHSTAWIKINFYRQCGEFILKFVRILYLKGTGLSNDTGIDALRLIHDAVNKKDGWFEKVKITVTLIVWHRHKEAKMMIS